MKRFLLLLMVFTSIHSIFAQTSNCDDTPGGQLAVGTTCTPVTFNSTNNTDYWNDAFFWGVCNEDDFDDAWMWFDATSTSTTVTYTPSTGDPILTIFQGACSPTMASNIACSDNVGLTAETVTFATVPGTRYHIRIQNYNSNANMNGTVCAFSAGGGTTTASDCSTAVNVCTDLSFSIDPNGFGTINEIPASGSFGNPSINPASANDGCLLVGEYNSTWMIVNVTTTGNLEFVFGGLGAQTGYYDWIMYPYAGPASCGAIQANTVAPVRCNWNAVDFGGTGVSDVIPAGGDPGNYEPPLSVTAGQQYIICFSNYSNALTTVPLQFLTDPGDATVSCTPLGFSMEGLVVACHENSRTLNWNAPLQNNVNQFIAQMSRNGKDWETLASLNNGEVIENRIFFEVEDLTNTSILAYYRVLQVLNDGATIISPVVSADCDDEKDVIVLYPNPSNGNMNIAYSSNDEVNLQIHDVYGKLVFEQLLPEAKHSKTVQLRVENVPAGSYTYHVVFEEEVKSGTFIIVK